MWLVKPCCQLRLAPESLDKVFVLRELPDLFVTNAEAYRVGWQSSLGVVTPEMFEDNNQVWSGDHCSLDPALVPGILFSNRKLVSGKEPGIADVPASILKLIDVPEPEKLDGVPLF